MLDYIGCADQNSLMLVCYGKRSNFCTDTVDVDLPKVEEFLKEACFLKGHHHVHLLPTLGIAWRTGERPLVVLPFMARGSLEKLIRKPELVKLISKHLLITDLLITQSVQL